MNSFLAGTGRASEGGPAAVCGQWARVTLERIELNELHAFMVFHAGGAAVESGQRGERARHPSCTAVGISIVSADVDLSLPISIVSQIRLSCIDALYRSNRDGTAQQAHRYSCSSCTIRTSCRNYRPTQGLPGAQDGSADHGRRSCRQAGDSQRRARVLLRLLGGAGSSTST